MRAFLNSIMLAAVVAGESELEFTDGGSSESITYSALDGLVIPGYATSASVDAKIATINARIDTTVATTSALSARIDTINLIPGPQGAPGATGPTGATGAAAAGGSCIPAKIRGSNVINARSGAFCDV